MLKQKIDYLHLRLSEVNDKKKRHYMDLYHRILTILQERDLLSGDNTAEVIAKIDATFYELKNYVDSNYEDKKLRKVYRKHVNELIFLMKRDFDLHPKGSLQSNYMAMGVALGSGVGASLSATIGPAFISIGISMGIAIGLAIGSSKEKEAEKNNKLY